MHSQGSRVNASEIRQLFFSKLRRRFDMSKSKQKKVSLTSKERQQIANSINTLTNLRDKLKIDSVGAVSESFLLLHLKGNDFFELKNLIRNQVNFAVDAVVADEITDLELKLKGEE